MNSCLLEHSYAYGEILKAQHPVLGIAAIIVLVLFLLGLPGRILGAIAALIRSVVRFVFAILCRIIGFVFGLPIRLLKALFAGAPKQDLRTYVHRADMQNPYFYDINAKPPPKPQPRQRRILWSDLFLYLALIIDFMLIIDDYYNNCALLDRLLYWMT